MTACVMNLVFFVIGGLVDLRVLSALFSQRTRQHIAVLLVIVVQAFFVDAS